MPGPVLDTAAQPFAAATADRPYLFDLTAAFQNGAHA